MKLAYWMYAGPAHIGVLRVSSSFKNVHAIMHAPLGDDYFNVMRSMLERERDFTPVTASIVDRHVLARGSQEKVVENITRKNKEETPDLILLTPTCTSSILQEDLHNFVESALAKPVQIDEHADHKVTQQSALSSVSPLLPLEENTLIVSELDKKLSPSSKLHINMPNICIPEGEGEGEQTKNSIFVKSATLTNLSEEELLNQEHHTKTRNHSDVILADVNHYRVNELQAADRTLEQIVRYYISQAQKQNCLNITKTAKPSVNIIGIFTLGFHNQHDCRELKRLFNDLGIQINEIIPEGGNVHNLKKLPQAWFNFVPYREIGLMTAMYLKSEFNMPYVAITPMGLIDTAACIRSICKIITTQLLNQTATVQEPSKFIYPKATSLEQTNILETSQKETILKDNPDSGNTLSTTVEEIETLFNKYIDQQTRFVSQAAWFSRSIDCQNLTGKKAVVFGDATHSAAMTKLLAREMGIKVSCAGTYCKHDADWFREQVSGFCDQVLITDDHTQVGDMIAQLEPAAIFGTQMERHVGKRLDIPCGVISAPVHIQNFPLGYRPFLGYEGTNQIADLVYNSFNLGMEDHLLQIFGGHDSENNSSIATHLNTNNAINLAPGYLPEGEGSSRTSNVVSTISSEKKAIVWSPEGLAELNKVPGFVRGKVKRNTEKYALQKNCSMITVEVMYAAKEALSA
jgi:light-independent protochlorophyllide reductase subunit B|uniref:Light-independent protochlorophyllide reductase subunit B n=2 Tax=Chlamydomonas reinhardtii TaxID=3055 RepID=CHLB_CHLRE|nr:photochlorophyllide reductase subunit B [Chlamydomonas reinhardtii]P36437.2 RecName: Full=Light-independent protochlorophyllide reductase subunit B; Short=DPOR subunit B; Short=LI-POR subunit B [Chlamydomonas reinhardtii]AAB06265.1 subunit of light-independent protochlorophyllide reductase [Chlamydomonas reinhardtii]ACJ50093.1 photochlorophyllide reductase subunit B [Chlamydomonas reinhardtii]ASF83372.1 photochlorophyllide reductase subunit B [Chlamydomonas reinhardtii]ASF83440.1 photochlor|eukprot:NP_958360.1 photochlorophyllide reductase subunit B (chloroplast) [Chlamydomonas reinhardtii]